MTKTVLSQRLRAAREAITPEITQRDVAKRLELSPSAVNLWEAGKTEPSAHAIKELATWYGVSADWLLGVDDAKLPAPTRKAKSEPSTPPLHTVPVVTPSSMVKWHWDNAVELLQTIVAHPALTAAAMLVASDALSSTCPNGSYVVVSKAHAPQPGDIVLAKIGRAGEPVLRRYVREGGDDLLVADDTRYPTYRMADGAKVIGRAVEVIVRKQL